MITSIKNFFNSIKNFFNSIKTWHLVLTLIFVLSFGFTLLTLVGNNPFAKLTLPTNATVSAGQTYSIDIEDVDNQETLKEEIDLLVQKQIVKEKQAEIEEKEKELNAEKTSLR